MYTEKDTGWQDMGRGNYVRKYPGGFRGEISKECGSYYPAFFHETHEKGKDQLYEPAAEQPCISLLSAQAWCDEAYSRAKYTPNLGRAYEESTTHYLAFPPDIATYMDNILPIITEPTAVVWLTKDVEVGKVGIMTLTTAQRRAEWDDHRLNVFLWVFIHPDDWAAAKERFEQEGVHYKMGKELHPPKEPK